MNAKSLQAREAQLDQSLEVGQFYRNGNGVTFEVTGLDESSILLLNIGANGKESSLSRKVFCQLYARNNYEFVKDPNASREFELTKMLELNRLTIK